MPRFFWLVLLCLGCSASEPTANPPTAPTAPANLEAGQGEVDVEAIDRKIVQDSIDLVSDLELEVSGGSDEWHFSDFVSISGPVAELIIREPITNETADQLLKAWKKPTNRLFSSKYSEERLEAFIRESVAECLASNKRTIRKTWFEQWNVELHIKPAEPDIEGDPTFISLELRCRFKTELQKAMDAAKQGTYRRLKTKLRQLT